MDESEIKNKLKNYYKVKTALIFTYQDPLFVQLLFRSSSI
jgi:hypothetical protein